MDEEQDRTTEDGAVDRPTGLRQRLLALRALLAVGLAAVIIGGLGGVALARGGEANDGGGFGGPGGRGGAGLPGGSQRGRFQPGQQGGPFGGAGGTRQNGPPPARS